MLRTPFKPAREGLADDPTDFVRRVSGGDPTDVNLCLDEFGWSSSPPAIPSPAGLTPSLLDPDKAGRRLPVYKSFGDTTDDDLCLDEFGCVEYGHICTRPNEEWDRSYDTSPGQAGVVIEPPSPP